VCSSGDSMTASRLPVVLNVGGLIHEDPGKRDPEANIRFAVQVRCGLCGYIMLFDAEQFHHGDVPTMTIGDGPD
jgi:hypothetical protein